MTVTVLRAYENGVAAEIRAWMGRRGLNQVRLAGLMDESPIWISRKLRGQTAITVEDLANFAQALDCGVADLLPRLDSNQQPSGSPFPLVTAA